MKVKRGDMLQCTGCGTAFRVTKVDAGHEGGKWAGQCPVCGEKVLPLGETVASEIMLESEGEELLEQMDGGEGQI